MNTPAHATLSIPTPQKTGGENPDRRMVLCITASAQTKMPSLAGLPSCLLPAGHQTLLERLLSQCAALGIKTVDLLVSEDPHAVRKITGEGERWGLSLHWHWLANGKHLMQHIHKLSARWLANPSQESGDMRLVIGHAHHWISTPLLHQLADRDMVLIHEDIVDAHCGDPWTGWMSVSPQTCVNWCDTTQGTVDEHDMLTQLATGQIAPLHIATPDQLQSVTNSRELLAVNRLMLQEPVVDQPVTWLRKPWGMMSPLAHVAAGANVQGPVSVGPGCWVMDGAQIGPYVTLTKDVVVHANTTIADTIVFEKTYVGSGLDIAQALVSANHMEQPQRKVSFALPVADGRLLPMGQEPALSGRPRTHFLSRLLAALMLLPLSPVVGLCALSARLRSQALPWTVLEYSEKSCPQGALGASRGPQTHKLRVEREDLGTPNWAQKLIRKCNLTFAAWLDIAQGHRCWVGIRPHLAEPDEHLPADWQNALRRAPIGWLHAQAWKESAHTDQLWSQASADVFWIMQSNLSLGTMRRLKNSLGLRPW